MSIKTEELDDAELMIISGALGVICEMEFNSSLKKLEGKVTRIALRKIKESSELSEENSK